MILHPRSLQQRTFIYTILPTFVLLLALSFVGFVLVRDILVNQWGEVAVSRLERSARLIDDMLEEPKKLLLMLQNGDDSIVSSRFVNHIINQIKDLEGVNEVIVEWPETLIADTGSNATRDGVSSHRPGRFQLSRFDISSPRYDRRVNNQTISLVSEFTGMNDTTAGRIEVKLSFATLLDHVVNAPWWKGNKAFLLDGSYNVLITTGEEIGLEDNYPMRMYGTMNKLEKDTLQAIQESSSGTVLGPGSPPEEISGFYHLSQAPWTLVVTATGEKVLKPIIKFRTYYILSLAGCICLILIFIRLSMNRVTASIKQLSQASNDLASGRFGPPLEATTQDEVGELTANFNRMTRQLKQRLELKKNIDLAREVQQNLLPQKGLKTKGIEICGKTRYCDETGGDYFDILQLDGNDRKVGVVVGDVVGHGVGAALLMTTVRALVRSSFNRSDSPDMIMEDVNRLLCQDTAASGSFVTLFYFEIDPSSTKVLRWVRAGHEPALRILCETGAISELRGGGIALGIDPDFGFTCNETDLENGPQLILICSDGVFEALNRSGEQFGKNRVEELLAATRDQQPETIIDSIIDSIQSFTDGVSFSDDLTLVIIKVQGGSGF